MPTDTQNVGLINTVPGIPGVLPGTVAPGPAPSALPSVSGYTPSNATATPYTPNEFTVAPNMTVASQIKDIVASGSPLMQQAETNARNMMNSRGLLNSSAAISAGQDSLYKTALPIATADAQTYARAGENSVLAQNQAMAQNVNLQTQTSQYNAGQANAALSQQATASNQFASSRNLAELQASTQTELARLQSDTSLTLQERQDRSAVVLQNLQNAGNLEAIRANREGEMAVAQLTNDNKLLLQASSSAGAFYSEALKAMAQIVQNKDFSEENKKLALNSTLAQLQGGLKTIGQISNLNLEANLDFEADIAADPNLGAGSGGGGDTGSATGGGGPPPTVMSEDEYNAALRSDTLPDNPVLDDGRIPPPQTVYEPPAPVYEPPAPVYAPPASGLINQPAPVRRGKFGAYIG